MDAIKLQNRAKYISSLKQEVVSNFDNVDKFTTWVKQAAPDDDKLYSLKAILYAVKSDGTRVDPPNFERMNATGYIYLGTVYSTNDLKESYGCKELPENPTYTGKMCEFSMDYIATESNQVLSTVDYSVSIKIPKLGSSTVSITATKIYKDLCDCEILSAYPLIVQAYTDSACTVPLTGNSLVYASTLCLKLTSTNSLASSYNFVPTSLIMTYSTTSGSPISVEIIPVASIVKSKGMAMLTFDVLTTGNRVHFTSTLILQSAKRMLHSGRNLEDIAEGMGLQGTSAEFSIVEEINNKSTDKDETSTNTASGLNGSIIGLFVMLFALLI